MCASQHYSINITTLTHQLTSIFLNKIIRSRPIKLPILNKRHPHRTCLLINLHTRPQMLHLQHITLARYRTRSSHNPHLPRPTILSQNLRTRPYYAQHTLPPRRVYSWQVHLLYRPQCLRRRRITSQYNKLCPHPKKPLHSLQCKPIHHIKRTSPIRSPRIITQINIIILWQSLPHGTKYRQPPIPRIKQSYHNSKYFIQHPPPIS